MKISSRDGWKSRALIVDPRMISQSAHLSINDVYDAIVELVTNADDRYQILQVPGIIEIEIVRKKGSASILRVRDYADGMSSEIMEEKIGQMGKRQSGLESGAIVRGTNSKGAKDIAALGEVTFESIAEDGCYHRCKIIPPRWRFLVDTNTPHATTEIRDGIGIPTGTGTLVTILVEDRYVINQHDILCEKVKSLVALRDILRDQNRTIIIRDMNGGIEEQIKAPEVYGRKVLSVRIVPPGYGDEAEAKLRVFRSESAFVQANRRFRPGGILIKSRHAIHEATLFDFEREEYASRLYGKLTCEYIDDLGNEYDDRNEQELDLDPKNSVPILDPDRRTGLTKDHPFVKALFKQASAHLRPIIENERREAEKHRKKIESDKTRRRLNSLERVAAKFMAQHSLLEEDLRDPTKEIDVKRFGNKGYLLSPPYSQIVVGLTQKCYLTIKRSSFPELSGGQEVILNTSSDEILVVEGDVELTSHSKQPDELLQAIWTVKGMKVTSACSVAVSVGEISNDITMEILESESDKYNHIEDLVFSRQKYSVRQSKKKKKLKLLAPIGMFPTPVEIDLHITGTKLKVSGTTIMRPKKSLGVAIGNLTIKLPDKKLEHDDKIQELMTAIVGTERAETEIHVFPDPGAGISIKLADVDFTNQRYKWRTNVLEIAAKHKAISRYLGAREKNYPGQDEIHSRVMIAEIVADAVCQRLLADRAERDPIEFEDADWDAYYAAFSKLMSAFLPLAHAIVVPEF